MAGVRYLADGRAAPVPDRLTAPFWAAARDHRLVRPVCDRCARSFFTPQVACPHCLSTAWAWTESAGTGVVSTYTVCHRGPGPGYATPYALVVVDLDGEGWSMLSNLVGCPPQTARIGLPVHVAFQQLDDDIALPVFSPAISTPLKEDAA